MQERQTLGQRGSPTHATLSRAGARRRRPGFCEKARECAPSVCHSFSLGLRLACATLVCREHAVGSTSATHTHSPQTDQPSEQSSESKATPPANSWLTGELDKFSSQLGRERPHVSPKLAARRTRPAWCLLRAGPSRRGGAHSVRHTACTIV